MFVSRERTGNFPQAFGYRRSLTNAQMGGGNDRGVFIFAIMLHKIGRGPITLLAGVERVIPDSSERASWVGRIRCRLPSKKADCGIWSACVQHIPMHDGGGEI
jgi:hypothetical protein